MKKAAFTIVDDKYYYPIGTHIFVNTFLRFHPDVDLYVFRQDKVDEVFKDRGINFYQAKPHFAELVVNKGYDLVVNIDADTVICDRMTEVFDNVDYHICSAWNHNDYEDAEVENITAEMYLQAGLVGSTEKDFWMEWQKANFGAMKYLRKENDTLNLMAYNHPKISKMKLKIVDKDKNYYGCKSLGREPEFYVEDDKLMCRGEQIIAYHFARGNVFPKLNFKAMPFKLEVIDWLDNISIYGNSYKIQKI